MKDLNLELPGVTEYKGLTINVVTDSEPESPREWCNLGTMYCEHRRYSLGDDNAKDKLIEDIRNSPKYRAGWEDKYDFTYGAGLMKMAELCGFIILPLYLYDHSGITMNTRGFSCPWDSGMVGFIYVTPDMARAELGVGRLTKKGRERIEGILRAEVATYDQFLRGDVWGWYIEDEDGHLDGCWGYFDLDAVGDDIKMRLPNCLELTQMGQEVKNEAI